jgi:predicted ATP-dependent endonuclease of OLD family
MLIAFVYCGFGPAPTVTVKFHRELTVLVGENNGGKSNIIDGLRLLTLPRRRRRDRPYRSGRCADWVKVKNPRQSRQRCG